MREAATRLLLRIITMLAFAGAGFAARVDGNISLVAQPEGDLSSYSWAQYYDTLGFTHEIYIQGTHSISGDVDILQWGSYNGRYEGTRRGSWSCGTPYEARNFAQAYPLGPGTNDFVPGGPWTANTNSPACSPPHRDPEPEPYNPFTSPIVINLSGGYALSGADDPVQFDIDGNGQREAIGWTARGSDEAFLALDRDGNGLITNGTELFGTATPVQGHTAANGFEALKSFDENGDGIIDSRDAIWTDLLLWRDIDHDGRSATTELLPIDRTPVSAIGLEFRWTGRRDRYGNQFRYEAWVETDRGRHTRRTIYDIFFIMLP
jgi:hypothetical protein